MAIDLIRQHVLDALADVFLTHMMTMEVDFLQDQLVKRDFTVSCMHADLSQKERDLVMRHLAALCIALGPKHDLNI